MTATRQSHFRETAVSKCALPELRLEERANEVSPYPPCLVETERYVRLSGKDLDELKLIGNVIDDLRWSIQVAGAGKVTMCVLWRNIL